MNALVLSDLHLEFHDRDDYAIIGKIPNEGVDALILAGDIVPIRFYRDALEILGRIVERFHKVIMVAGNHEHYKTRAADVDILLKYCEEALSPNFSYLRPGNVVEYHGTRFVGTTGWFPKNPTTQMFQGLLNDFDCIKDFTPWVYEQYKLGKTFLEREVREGDVVITHHAPSVKSIQGRYAGNPANCYYVSEFEHIIYKNKPSLWIHGHMHLPVDYKLGDTRIYSNPVGYPREFDPVALMRQIEI